MNASLDSSIFISILPSQSYCRSVLVGLLTFTDIPHIIPVKSNHRTCCFDQIRSIISFEITLSSLQSLLGKKKTMSLN